MDKKLKSSLMLRIGLMTLMLSIGLIGLASAAQESLGTFKAGEDILLVQLCGDCTYNNITSVTPPNNSTELVTDVEMTKSGTKYTYLLSGNYTSETGTYNINGVGDLGGSTEIWSYTLEVTPNGEEPNTGKGLIQIVLLVTIIIFFIFAIVGIYKVEDYKGRFALYWVAHILGIAASFVAWNMSQNFLTGTPFITGFFRIVFFFLTIGAFPMVILSLAWVFYIHLLSDDMKKMMERGIDEDEAFERARSNIK